MTSPSPSQHPPAPWTWARIALTAALLGTGLAPEIDAQAPSPSQSPQSPTPPSRSRQVTLFGILATPVPRGSKPTPAQADQRLRTILPQLNKLLPDHTFRLLDVKSERLAADGSITCDLGDGFVAETRLITPLDDDGKVQFKIGLRHNHACQFETEVTAPPNQLFFGDKMLANRSRLLVGIGAR